MCNWQNRISPYGIGNIQLNADVFADACNIIFQASRQRNKITYSDLMSQLRQLNHRKIFRGTIGIILDEVNLQVSSITNPSIYPSAIVVHRGTTEPGPGFWNVACGLKPPVGIAANRRSVQLQQYQNFPFP